MLKEDTQKITEIDIPDILAKQLLELCMIEVNDETYKTPSDVRAFKLCSEIFPPGLIANEIKMYRGTIQKDPRTTVIFYKLWVMLNELLHEIDPNKDIDTYIVRRAHNATSGYENDPLSTGMSFLEHEDLYKVFKENHQLFIASLINTSPIFTQYKLKITREIRIAKNTQ